MVINNLKKENVRYVTILLFNSEYHLRVGVTFPVNNILPVTIHVKAHPSTRILMNLTLPEKSYAYTEHTICIVCNNSYVYAVITRVVRFHKLMLSTTYDILGGYVCTRSFAYYVCAT